MICDFGLARVTTSATTLDNMKFRDIGGFSPRYAAPEVLANSVVQNASDPEIDKKSDVYSFAIIIWELLTRRIPWNGLKREEIEMSVRGGLRVSSSSSFPLFPLSGSPIFLLLSLLSLISPPMITRIKRGQFYWR